jgi:hypothetical protein
MLVINFAALGIQRSVAKVRHVDLLTRVDFLESASPRATRKVTRNPATHLLSAMVGIGVVEAALPLPTMLGRMESRL